LVSPVSATDIQASAQAQAEDAGVAGETESAEVEIDGLLLSRRVRLEHHWALRAESSCGQRRNDGGAYQEK
jgi:hypothetical protein